MNVQSRHSATIERMRIARNILTAENRGMWSPAPVRATAPDPHKATAGEDGPSCAGSISSLLAKRWTPSALAALANLEINVIQSQLRHSQCELVTKHY